MLLLLHHIPGVAAKEPVQMLGPIESVPFNFDKFVMIVIKMTLILTGQNKIPVLNNESISALLHSKHDSRWLVTEKILRETVAITRCSRLLGY